MAAKILFNGSEVGEFLTDSDFNYMGVIWSTDLDEATQTKIQDHVVNNYISSANKIPASSINITTAQLG